jgi:hypothetical protein
VPIEDQQMTPPQVHIPGVSPDPNVPESQASSAEEVEVEFNSAAGAEYDQKPPEAPKVAEPVEDVLDKIVPKKDPKVWEIGPAEMRRTLVQKPLSFIGKMQWFSLVGGVLDKALSGPDGMSLNSLLDTPGGRRGVFTLADFRDADMFVQAIGKLLSAAPDFLVDSYMIWLNVPDYDREVVRDLMKLPPDEGGLSDDQGFEIIEIFLDQNYESLATFFGDRLGQLQARVSKLNKDRASRR